MAEEKILENETLNDAELTNVAGGSYSECMDDIDRLRQNFGNLSTACTPVSNSNSPQ